MRTCDLNATTHDHVTVEQGSSVLVIAALLAPGTSLATDHVYDDVEGQSPGGCGVSGARGIAQYDVCAGLLEHRSGGHGMTSVRIRGLPVPAGDEGAMPQAMELTGAQHPRELPVREAEADELGTEHDRPGTTDNSIVHELRYDRDETWARGRGPACGQHLTSTRWGGLTGHIRPVIGSAFTLPRRTSTEKRQIHRLTGEFDTRSAQVDDGGHGAAALGALVGRGDGDEHRGVTVTVAVTPPTAALIWRCQWTSESSSIALRRPRTRPSCAPQT